MKINTIKHLSRISKDERGLTLVEIIVVLIILAVLMGWMAGRIFGMGDAAKEQMTRLKMEDLKQKIFLYQLKNNTFPQDLKSVTTAESDLADAWGNPIQFRSLEGGRAYELKSLGADGREGGDADVTITGP